MPRSQDLQMEDDDGYDDARKIVNEKEDIDEKYPDRPRNTKQSLPFSVLYKELFNPLLSNIKRPAGPKVFVTKQKKPHEKRQEIIHRFISRWRKDVGNDIYPAFRLIMPDKDRERTVYGLKEKALGNILIKVLHISRDSEDAYNLLNWKQPRLGGGDNKAAGSGDFPARCYEAVSKRALRTDSGDLTIDEVNEMLTQLAEDTKEKHQLPIIQEFYSRMNADEIQWIIRIILKQMKVGATEKTFFDCWHEDADGLFNVSSSLKRVCWELWDPDFRLNVTDKGVKLMNCFQPQLAQFQIKSFDEVIKKMRPTDEDDTFWIEEKMDGERMQLHMNGDGQFKFWSRKAKDYTDHYGSSIDDGNGTLTRHLGDAFISGVRNIILDGEMITWDPIEDAMVPFGTLKSAVIAQRTDDPNAHRPFYRVFDILFLNDTSLINYTLRDRRKALEASVNPIPRRLEIHEFTEGRSIDNIKDKLRDVIALSSEGLVIKNPRSIYRLGDRNDDWMKVKPEYMREMGENFDLLIIGGYYGEGRRGGKLSSFMCGLKVPGNDTNGIAKFYSFCKVGGGFTAFDYSTIRHKTDGKWRKWDPRKPPTDYIELAGGSAQYERPDEWILPQDSLIISIKGASVGASDQFMTGLTLRFPRFIRLREDRDYTSAMSLSDFYRMKRNIEEKKHEQDLQIEQKRRATKRVRKELKIAGADMVVEPLNVNNDNLFEGMNFWIITESSKPRKSKAEIEGMIKACGGKIYQSEGAADNMRCIADKSVVKVMTLKKKEVQVIRPQWVFDSIDSNCVLPLEVARHMLYIPPGKEDTLEKTVDNYGDSFYRDVTVEDLGRLLTQQLKLDSKEEGVSQRTVSSVKDQISELDRPLGWMFEGVVAYLDTRTNARKNHISPAIDNGCGSDLDLLICQNIIEFANGQVRDDIDDEGITHIILDESDLSRVKDIRKLLQTRDIIPRVVIKDWIDQSWAEETLLSAENFPVNV